MISIKIVYVANIIVAGWIGISALFFPKTAAATVFEQAYPATETMRLVGCLWLSIAILSLLGLWRPLTFSPVLLVQLIYKSTWLICVGLPAMYSGQAYPKSMAIFFVLWIVFLPLVIPWQHWLAKS